jgi:predicted ester cyclase
MEGYSRNSQEENHVFKGVNSMSTTEAENKAQIRRIYEEMFNQGNLAIADELIAPDILNHAAPPGSNRGPESMRQLITMLSTAFPDMHYTIEEMVAEGDMVACRMTMSGTHQGPLIGIAPTGRSVRQQSQMHFLRFRNGKVIEHWAVRDDLGMMRQLDVIPAPADA